MSLPTARLDLLTRQFWRLSGRPVDLTGDEAWLAASMSPGPSVGDAWVEPTALAWGGQALDRPHAGLLADMAQLDGSGFRAADLRPEISDFYEHTSDWRMEVWTQWSPLFQPGGELVSRLFGRRVQQLALPTRPLEVAHGMDSRVTVLTDATGAQRAAAWLRTSARAGSTSTAAATPSAPSPAAPSPGCTSRSPSSRATSRSS